MVGESESQFRRSAPSCCGRVAARWACCVKTRSSRACRRSVARVKAGVRLLNAPSGALKSVVWIVFRIGFGTGVADRPDAAATCRLCCDDSGRPSPSLRYASIERCSLCSSARSIQRCIMYLLTCLRSSRSGSLRPTLRRYVSALTYSGPPKS